MSETSALRGPSPSPEVLEAWRAFTTPVRRPPSTEERRVLTGAETSSLSISEEGLESGSCRVAVYAWGAGPPVLLVHGWEGSSGQLGAFVDAFVSAGHRVVAIDLPAHGRSEGARTNIYGVAAAVRAAEEAYGTFRGIVGHSLGAAAVGYATASLPPERRPGALVLVSAIGRLETEVAKLAARLALSPEVERRLREYMEGLFGQDVWDETDLAEVGGKISVPALVVHDRDDPRIDWRTAARLARAWPASRFLMTTGLGHSALLKSPEVVSRAVAFLADPAR